MIRAGNHQATTPAAAPASERVALSKWTTLHFGRRGLEAMGKWDLDRDAGKGIPARQALESVEPGHSGGSKERRN